MKIIDNVLKPYKFKDLGEGATFKYNNEYFIRLNQEIRDQYGPYNAVRLTDGALVMCSEGNPVIPFNCELIVL